MRPSLISSLLALCGSSGLLVSAAAVPAASAPALPLSQFEHSLVTPISLEEAKEALKHQSNAVPPEGGMSIAANCANPRTRVEWDNYSNADRTAFVNAVKCLLKAPSSGQFPASKSRYEDLVALHQKLTPNVHNNSKFLLWHRYYLWVFEDMLRQDCGFQGSIPWFDETKYPGKFSQSSIFSSQWFGGIALGGGCVPDGQFANLALNVGPGVGNTPHCLARAGDGAITRNCNSELVNTRNAFNTFSEMARCQEQGVHAHGHNGIGAVMRDAYASPSDPVFFLHHAFVDRNFRIWQNANAARVGTIDGTDSAGNRITLDTNINVYGFRKDVKVRDILDTKGETLCYKYNY